MANVLSISTDECLTGPEFNIHLRVVTDKLTLDCSELSSDLEAFKEYLIKRYYLEDEKAKNNKWWEFWK